MALLLPLWISVLTLDEQVTNRPSTKSFSSDVNESELRVLTWTVFRHRTCVDARPRSRLRSKPISVKPFLSIVVVTAPCWSKLSHRPLLRVPEMALPLLTAQMRSSLVQPSDVSVSATTHWVPSHFRTTRAPSFPPFEKSMLIRTSLIVLPPTSVGGLSVGTTNEQGGAGHGGLLSRPITAWFNSMPVPGGSSKRSRPERGATRSLSARATSGRSATRGGR